jgi:hypothetical protein
MSREHTRRQTILRSMTSRTHGNADLLAKRSYIRSLAEPLLQAPAKCKRLWRSLHEVDYKKLGYLNDTSIQMLWDSN